MIDQVFYKYIVSIKTLKELTSSRACSLDISIDYQINIIQGEKDDKIIAVCADDPEYKHYTDIKELPPHRLTEIRRFFEDCILLNLY